MTDYGIPFFSKHAGFAIPNSFFRIATMQLGVHACGLYATRNQTFRKIDAGPGEVVTSTVKQCWFVLGHINASRVMLSQSQLNN